MCVLIKMAQTKIFIFREDTPEYGKEEYVTHKHIKEKTYLFSKSRGSLAASA